MPKNNNPYHFLETYCLRTPLLPLTIFYDIFNEKKLNIEHLKKMWGNPILKEAIFLGSPELYYKLEDYFSKSISDNERLEHAFLKYCIRASSRCTPFGLFASVATGQLSATTSITLNRVNSYERITKLDTNYIDTLLTAIVNNKNVKEQLKFYSNTTLYKIANQYRYIEYQLEDTSRTYSIEAVENTIHLEKIITASKTGKTITQLADYLIDDSISKEDAENYINLLIDNQILVSELDINVTGEDTLDLIIDYLKKLSGTNQLITSLKELKVHLNLIDQTIGNNITTYKNFITEITALHIPFKPKYLFQTDVFTKTQTNTINYKHAYTIKKALPFLNKLNNYYPNKRLEEFKTAFIKRYESKEMPLAHVLDIETGIGYLQNNSISDTTPFLEGITPKNILKNEDDFTLSTTESMVYKKLLQTIKNDNYILELLDNDLKNITSNWQHSPDTLSAFTEIITTKKQEQIVLKGLSAYAGNLIARFSYENKEFLDYIKHISQLEQQMQPKAVIAEIVHLPESRTGNILKRPHIRNYEIPYLGKSTLPKTQQIPLDDLFISVKKHTIILKSKKLQKQVIPRLTNAHNYAPKALPIYHFLCDLQHQNKKSHFGFTWPKLAEKHFFLPRVTYNTIILKKARWQLDKKAILYLTNCKNDAKKMLNIVKQWQKRYKVPNYVQLVDYDNTLLINLESTISIKLAFNTIKNKHTCIFEEFLFSTKSIVKQKNKPFTNECIFTFYNQTLLK